MCRICENEQSINPENVEDFLGESSGAALHACMALASGYTNAAKGFMRDVGEDWGIVGLVRMAYVWGSARHFLPMPEGVPGADLGFGRVEELLERACGEKPDPAKVAQIVRTQDIVTTLATRITDAASLGDVHTVGATMVEASEQDLLMPVILGLLGNAAPRVDCAEGGSDEYQALLTHLHKHVNDPGEHYFEQATAKWAESAD